MTDQELMQQALEALTSEHSLSAEAMQQRMDAITALRERLAQPEAPVLTGVDCSCGRKWRIVNNTLTASEPETVMAEYKFQTYAAYKTDGEMKIGVVPEQDDGVCRHCDDSGCVACDARHQPEQEAVAWAFRHSDGSWHDVSDTEHSPGMVPLYTTPPRREWVGLTLKETTDTELSLRQYYDSDRYDLSLSDYARAIEAKLRERNQ